MRVLSALYGGVFQYTLAFVAVARSRFHRRDVARSLRVLEFLFCFFVGNDEKKESPHKVEREHSAALLKPQVDEVGPFVALAAVCHLSDIAFEEVAGGMTDDAASQICATDLRRAEGWFGAAGNARPALEAAALALGVRADELGEALISRRVATVRVPRGRARPPASRLTFVGIPKSGDIF